MKVWQSIRAHGKALQAFDNQGRVARSGNWKRASYWLRLRRKWFEKAKRFESEL